MRASSFEKTSVAKGQLRRRRRRKAGEQNDSMFLLFDCRKLSQDQAIPKTGSSCVQPMVLRLDDCKIFSFDPLQTYLKSGRSLLGGSARSARVQAQLATGDR